MELNEHKVARNVAKNEVLKMIDDFRSGNPKLQECEWEEGGKNYTFKNEFDDFFGEEAPKVKNAEVKELVENPILFDEPEANVNLLLAEKLSDHQIAYLVKLAHQCNARVRVVYCFPFVANEKHMVKGMGKFFVKLKLKNPMNQGERNNI